MQQTASWPDAFVAVAILAFIAFITWVFVKAIR